MLTFTGFTKAHEENLTVGAIGLPKRRLS